MATDITRRKVLIALLLGVGIIARPMPAFAKDGSDDGGGGSGGGDDGGGGDDHSSSGDSDDDGDDQDSDSEADEAKSAVSEGEAAPMRLLKRHLRQNYPGKVLDIDLKRSSGRYHYRVKVLRPDGKVLRLRLDAKTLQQR